MAEHIYSPADRPLVEVLVNDAWYPGELRGWWDRAGERRMNVSWTVDLGETYIETVRIERVRLLPDEAPG